MFDKLVKKYLSSFLDNLLFGVGAQGLVVAIVTETFGIAALVSMWAHVGFLLATLLGTTSTLPFRAVVSSLTFNEFCSKVIHLRR